MAEIKLHKRLPNLTLEEEMVLSNMILEAYTHGRRDAQPKWIPVSERLPEEGVTVLCWYEYFRFGNYNRMYQTYGIGYYFRDGMWGGEVSNGQRCNVLAWQPLPGPPKEGADNGND